MRILVVVVGLLLCQDLHAWRILRHRFESVFCKSDTDWPSLWFEQPVDNFSPADLRRWKQRYMVREDFYNATLGGPAILYLNGEGPMGTRFMESDQPIKYAKEFGGIFFQLEHRYYGETFPTPGNTTASLQYLSSEQALADAANFIQAMNQKHNLSSASWIVVGGSYAGSLAAWLRYKYPHLVAGAVSASGPVLAQINYPEYYDTVQKSIETHSPDCAKNIRAATQEMDELIQNVEGQRKLTKLFKLCQPLEETVHDPLIVGALYHNPAEVFAGAVQYNHDNVPGIYIDTLCEVMNSAGGTPLERYAKLSPQSPSACNPSGDLHNWYYQVCTEFGYLQVSFNNSIFGNTFPVEIEAQICKHYAEQFDLPFLYKAADRTNLIFGGLDPAVSNVVFVNGDIDPWHRLSIVEDLNEDSPAFLIKGASHCSILLDPAPGEIEPAEQPAIRLEVLKLIKKWIS